MKFPAVVALAAALVGGSAWAADPVQWTTGSGGNGHYYLFVPDAVTGETAFTAAAASTYLGLPGYLATVTSAAENTFVSSDIASGGLAWLGGIRTGPDPTNWKWAVGPEAGQAFTFTQWSGGEPNNCCGGENYVHTNWAPGGFWNDHGGPGNPGQINGYVIEFSAVAAVPEPQTYALMLAGLLTVGTIAWRKPKARRV